MLVQAVGRGVEFAIIKPLVEGRVGLIQRSGEGLGPHHILTRQPGPEAFKIFFGFGAQGVVTLHARHQRRLNHGFAGREHAVFNQQGFDGRGWGVHKNVS